MEIIPAVIFDSFGTLAGLVVSGLGLAALKHIVGPTESDRVVGWTLWW
jgi:multisubunit Na+/H+ antiporter MnhF subunit